MAYSIYRTRLAEKLDAADTMEDTPERHLKVWDAVLRENIFVLCKTQMAKSITRRTLRGFRPAKVNTRYFEDLINQISNKTAKFVSQMKQGKNYWKANEDNDMKFTAIVGNPPYQHVVAQKESTNGQKVSISIFHHFQMVSDKIGRYTSLIYPGSRWIHRAGKGMEQFGLDQINDPHLSMIQFYPNSTDIFKEVGIADGLSIVLKDMHKTENGFRYIYREKDKSVEVFMDNPGTELIPLNPGDGIIAQRLDAMLAKYKCLHDSILPRSLFSIESDFVEKNPTLVREYYPGDYFDPVSEIKLFTNDKAGKSGRARWYVASKNIITSGHDHLHKWKVIVSSANAGGQKRSNQIEVVDDYSAFGRARIALKTFNSEKEAINFCKYASSDLIKFAFLLTGDALTSLAKRVPDLVDYTDANGLIDYSKDVNEQLYELFGIDEDNQRYIESVFKDK
jgi:hypothetical protein